MAGASYLGFFFPPVSANSRTNSTAHTISQRVKSLKRIPPELIPLGTGVPFLLGAFYPTNFFFFLFTFCTGLIIGYGSLISSLPCSLSRAHYLCDTSNTDDSSAVWLLELPSIPVAESSLPTRLCASTETPPSFMRKSIKNV